MNLKCFLCSFILHFSSYYWESLFLGLLAVGFFHLWICLFAGLVCLLFINSSYILGFNYLLRLNFANVLDHAIIYPLIFYVFWYLTISNFKIVEFVNLFPMICTFFCLVWEISSYTKVIKIIYIFFWISMSLLTRSLFHLGLTFLYIARLGYNFIFPIWIVMVLELYFL